MVASGRTDRGVHARMQVVGIKLKSRESVAPLVAAIKAQRGESLGVAAAQVYVPTFHPMWIATAKEYRFRLQLGGTPSPAWKPYCWEVSEHPRLQGHPVIVEKLQQILALYPGTRDFTAFHAKSSPQIQRTLHRVDFSSLGEGLFEVRLIGKGFARYQVRYLVGSAVAGAAGQLPKSSIEDALHFGTAFPGLRAPAHGLVLWKVFYPPGLALFSGTEEAFPAERLTRAPFIPGGTTEIAARW